nr:hypothetical protein [uncultured Emticicia sp.]
MAIVWFYPIWFYNYVEKDSVKRGTFGDMYGALNTLFSGLAFVSLIITLIAQFEEINQNRKNVEE